MKFIDYIEQIKRIDNLIKRRATGTPSQFAKRLDVSEATLYRCLNDLKELGAPISYCSDRQCYTYSEHFELVVLLTKVFLNDKNKR